MIVHEIFSPNLEQNVWPPKEFHISSLIFLFNNQSAPRIQ